MKAATIRFYTQRPLMVPRRLAQMAYEAAFPGRPWLARQAVTFCDEHLTTAHVGLEFGSGRSTVWFAPRVRGLTSIEHDPVWYRAVKDMLETHGMDNVRYLLVPLDHDPSEPQLPRYKQSPRYVAVSEEFADGELDFVVVDGHYRQACIAAATRKLKPGALLVVDNTNWLPRHKWGVPTDWALVHRSTNVMREETSIWRKPG
jgi:predicted O-methyltransferase YrrM